MKINIPINPLLLVFSSLLYSCISDSPSNFEHKNFSFQLLNSSHTGIAFTNTISESIELNFLNYPYIYNGGGVAVGDINNDGLDDVFLSSNQEANQLYINKGSIKFDNISRTAGIEDAIGWTTGVSMIDINNDGWLDIYVCKSGEPTNNELRKNKLFINNGNNTFTDQAIDYNLDDPGFSTQAYFFDLDNDNDLDMYLVNHRIDFKNNAKISTKLQGELSPFTSDKFFVNENGLFKEITTSGINKTWGLSAAVADYNNDGWQDIYVCNDFLEPDHLFINNKAGGFRDSVLNFMDHITFYSMGSDVADMNNDGLFDLMVLDMVSPDHIRSKRNMASMSADNFNTMVNIGYHHQYMSNALHLNRGNSEYSEIAQFSGLSKTDWSWSTLLADFDNDGFKDVFITNGVRRDITDNDLSNKLVRLNANGKSLTLKELFDHTNVEKLSNPIYKNERNTSFSNKTVDWGMGQKSFSNGMAYSDLDNDGDLDLVVNNLDHKAFIYKNNSSNNYISLKLQGGETNINGIGSIVEVFTSGNKQTSQLYVNRGFESSMSYKMNFGIGDNKIIDSLIVRWYNGKKQILRKLKPNQLIALKIENATETSKRLTKRNDLIVNATSDKMISYSHVENNYDDFKIEILLPQKLSNQGPRSCVSDVNGDGLEDLFITGSKGNAAVLFIQNSSGTFSRTNTLLWNSEKEHEDTGCLFFDCDNDNDLDLYVVSGGNEFKEDSPLLQDRLYLNDGKGSFSKTFDQLPKMNTSGYAIASADYDNDGDEDLFIGGRVIPGKYPLAPKSYLLQNNKGVFSNITEHRIKEVEQIGLVTDALFSDFDADNDLDLIVTGEWFAPTVFVNNDGFFQAQNLSQLAPVGWWYSVTSADFNSDGLPDYFVGNLGKNNKFNVKKDKSLHIYASDFDDSGNIDIVLANEQDNKQLPLRGRECSSQQMPFIEKKFPDFKSFSEADLNSIYTLEKLNSALHFSVNKFNTVLLINKGDGIFESIELPSVVQYGPVISSLLLDVNGDGLTDVIGAGNIFETEAETVMYDASKGFVLLNDGNNGFNETKNHVFLTKGNIKNLQHIKVGNQKLILALPNKGSIQIFKYN